MDRYSVAIDLMAGLNNWLDGAWWPLRNGWDWASLDQAREIYRLKAEIYREYIAPEIYGS